MPVLSLLIPTRERADTLLYTIKTALDNSFPDIEIIVSDNASADETKNVVESFSDHRLRYINPGRRLSMVDHWEFATLHARGDFLTIIGDDDAVNKAGFAMLIEHIRSARHKVYCWPTHLYFWPPSPGSAGIVAAKVTPSPPTEVNLLELVKKAAKWGFFNYAPLPHLYHSAVHRDILEAIKNATGSLFKTTMPDVYMAYAIPAFCPYAMNLGIAVTTNGHSPRSNGGSALLRGVSTSILDAFVKEYDNYKPHPKIPRGVDQRVALMLEPIFVARDLFPETYKGIAINEEGLWAFVESVLYSKLRFSVLRNWPEIRRTFPNLSMTKYIVYSHLFWANKIRTQWRAQKRTIGPDNVFDFARCA